MKKHYLVLILVAVFAALIAFVVLLPKASGSAGGGMPGGGMSGRAPGGASGGAPGTGSDGVAATAAVFRVRSGPATVRDLRSYLEINGDVEADSSIDVYPDTGGKLSQTLVSLGTKVAKGQVIATVDPSKPGVSYALSPVLAPISGTVTSVPVKTGSTVTTGTAVAVIGDIEKLQITARIPERNIAVLKTGLSAEISFEAYPGVVFGATVIRVSPLVDAVSRTKELYLSLDSADSRINAGMFAKIKLFTVLSPDCVTVPEDAIVSAYDVDSVFVLNADGTVSKRVVRKGVTVDGVVEIRSGVAGNEKVVIQGMQVLTDGATVRDISEAAK